MIYLITYKLEPAVPVLFYSPKLGSRSRSLKTIYRLGEMAFFLNVC